MFVIFKIRIGESKPSIWIDPKQWAHLQWPEQSIYNIYDFPNYKLEIDFNQPRFSQEKLVQITEAVEREYSVGVHFNQKGVREGVVWTE